MQKKINKIITNCILVIIIVLMNFSSIQADEMNPNDNLTNEKVVCVPSDVNEYFESIYNEALQMGQKCKVIEENVNLNNIKKGSPFVIYNVDCENSGICYFPLYNETRIIAIVAVGYDLDGTLFYNVIKEFVNQLNELKYCDNIYLYKSDEKIYSIDAANNTYEISGEHIQRCDKQIVDYNYIKNHIITNDTDLNIDGLYNEIPKNVCKSSAVQNITNGKECVMNNCFSRQNNNGICWAASIATILRYKNSNYINLGLNAYTVAYRMAAEYGLRTDDPDDKEGVWRCGADNYDVQYMLALYEVYYYIASRKLTSAEVRNEINSGNPIYMYASSYYQGSDEEKETWKAHATVLYGYYSKDRYTYYEIWNPGTGETQMAKDDGNTNVSYLYNNHNFSWKASVCNGAYIYK